MKRLSLIILLICIQPIASAQDAQRSLDIYWIDVDGGAATLIVTPERESVLMDSGFDLPDDEHAKRVVAAMTDAGISSLDYYIASHFHGDHVGSILSLIQLVGIGEFIDHGESVEQDTERGRPAWETYQAALQLADRRNSSPVRPHDILPLRGVDLTIVSSNLEVPVTSLNPQGPNALCEGADSGPEDTGENARSVGYLLSFGEFDFLNLGDLTSRGQHALACPENLIGMVDVLQIPHHGNDLAPQLIWALQATAAVSSNGARKGGSPEGYEVVNASESIEGIWQSHRALNTDNEHNTENDMIANLTEENDAGHWIKASVQPNATSYTITNSRNQFSKTYQIK
jgi:beta-lactamase superfamily II metal-dependent hydrolase